MEYIDGITPKEYVKRNGRFEARDICEKMIPLLRSLDKIHNAGLIHRDISPDNIMILSDGSLKLFDFGAARDYEAADQNGLSVIMKPGYAPEEQYRSRGQQGPFTDVYAICATLYFCITGNPPEESTQRVFDDDLKPLSDYAYVPEYIESAISKGMSIRASDRFQSTVELAIAFGDVPFHTSAFASGAGRKDASFDNEPDQRTEYIADFEESAEEAETEYMRTEYIADFGNRTESRTAGNDRT